MKIYCSFCGYSEDEVRAIVKQGRYGICDRCVGLCAGILLTQGHSIGEIKGTDIPLEPMPSKSHSGESEVKAEASGAGGDSQP